MSTSQVPAVIDNLLSSQAFIRSGEVARAAGVSRQAAHYHLRRMTEAGLLVATGAGRGAKYRRRALWTEQHLLDGLQEDAVWRGDTATLEKLSPEVFDNPNVRRILNWAFTEMLNNAIDHSDGTAVRVSWFVNPNHVAFEIEDDGIGVFRRVRESRQLETDQEAIGEISKGKQTTAPDQHSGMGIFFTTKMVNKFSLSSGQTSWSVDRTRDDQAIGWIASERKGTLVRCEIAFDTDRDPKTVFDAFSDPETLEFSHSTVRVDLFKEAGIFVSRSEAKRLAAHLDDFQRVEIDFTGIDEVGQGFIDELFRVWSRNHPHTELTPVHANPAVHSMIAKAVA